MPLITCEHPNFKSLDMNWVRLNNACLSQPGRIFRSSEFVNGHPLVDAIDEKGGWIRGCPKCENELHSPNDPCVCFTGE